jgi:MEMO1 family protein
MDAVLHHASPYAGSWYPENAAALRDLLARSFEQSAGRIGPYLRRDPVAFLVPHAAPAYSGTVAAAVYRNLQAHPPNRIVLLGFSHSWPVRGLGIPDVDTYTTPLGEVPVDHAAVEQILTAPAFVRGSTETLCDHSIEIQLPFLAFACPGTPVVPIYVGELNALQREQAAGVLRRFLDGSTVFLASSDLTHFGRDFRYQPFPVDAATPERLRELDERVLEAAGSLDPSLFLEELDRAKATVCGRAPIALLLEILGGAPGQEIFQECLDYQTSGEITGDFHHSVSYGALGYFPEHAFQLDAAGQAALLETARRTLDEFQHDAAQGSRPANLSPALGQHAPVFVTLYDRAGVRGCIGRCWDCPPLAQSIAELTISSATDDPRFRRVKPDENLDIEIHILSPMKRIRRGDQLIVDQHGACLESGGRKGLLLPKVATERGWNRERFLAALAEKAGVGSAALTSPDTRLFVFRAQTFSTRGHPGSFRVAV